MTAIERRVVDGRDLETLGSTLISARLSQLKKKKLKI